MACIGSCVLVVVVVQVRYVVVRMVRHVVAMRKQQAVGQVAVR